MRLLIVFRKTLQEMKRDLWVVGLTLAFGVIATPVRKLQDNWRFLRCGRDFSYSWNGIYPPNGGFTRSNTSRRTAK
jgi:hypothetical protein